MIRRLVAAGAISVAGLGATVLATPAAHAGQVCVSGHVTVAGMPLVDQSQCQATPGAPTPPPIP